MVAMSSLTIVDNRTSKRYDIPIADNAVKALDFKQVKTSDSDSGLCVFDAGLRNTAVLVSGVANLNGKKGTLHYRGLPIDTLFHGSLQYEDTLHLLVWGDVPSTEQKASIRRRLFAAMSEFPFSDVSSTIHTFSPSAAPIPMIIAGLSAYLASRPATIPAFAGSNLYESNLEAIESQIAPTLSALAIVVAMTYCHRTSRPFTKPSPNLSFVANVFHMLGRPLNANELTSMEKLWLLYADHGLANATTGFLLTASTRADPVSCLLTALSAGYGPLHGGAIDMVYHMLSRVGNKANVPALLSDVKAGKTKLYGFGHRIYSTVDPRAPLVKEVLNGLDLAKYEIIEVAEEIERLASADDWFQSRHIGMNVDLYGCFAYVALGLPADIIFPLTAIARAQGYMARWREFMMNNPPIWRPQQIYAQTPTSTTTPHNSKL